MSVVSAVLPCIHMTLMLLCIALTACPAIFWHCPDGTATPGPQCHQPDLMSSEAYLSAVGEGYELEETVRASVPLCAMRASFFPLQNAIITLCTALHLCYCNMGFGVLDAQMFYDLCLPHDNAEVVVYRQRMATLLALGYDAAAASHAASSQLSATADRWDPWLSVQRLLALACHTLPCAAHMHMPTAAGARSSPPASPT